jgi:hypothetical protein
MATTDGAVGTERVWLVERTYGDDVSANEVSRGW